MYRVYNINGSILTVNKAWCSADMAPITLNCVRVKYKPGTSPKIRTSLSGSGADGKYLINEADNIWDIYRNDTSWNGLLLGENNLLEVIGCNASGITDIGVMCGDCSSLTKVYLSGLSNVTSLEQTFRYCYALTDVIISDTSLTTINTAFKHCTSLTNVSIDTSDVTVFDYAFQGCTSLITAPILDMSHADSTYAMFDDCSSLVNIPQYSSNMLTDASAMFSGCSSLVTVPSFNFINLRNTVNMFKDCTSLTALPAFSSATLAKVSRTYGMFEDCINVETGIVDFYNSLINKSGLVTYPVTDYARTFRDCGSNTVTGAAELAQIPSDWK